MRLVTFICIFAALWWGLPGRAGAAPKTVPENRQQIRLSYAPLVKKVSPAVVNIYTRKVVKTRVVPPLFDDPFFRRFFGDHFKGMERKKVQNSLGSGVIVSADGLVVTNNHVIEGADDIKVVLADRREFDAKIIGTDERSDLAVLRIDNGKTPFTYLQMQDSDDLEVGDLVLAIGNPFGVGQTVTSGIVSALAQTRVAVTDFSFFIQTDAAINPGNSGGALVSMDGRLVGINTAIYSKSGGSVGIGFAIPSNLVRSVLSGIIDSGRLVRPWLGASGQVVSADIAASLDMARPAGVLIDRVHPKSPAAAAGLKVGDVLVSLNGREVDEPRALQFRLATLSIGANAELSILRRGKARTLKFKVAAPPEDPPRNETRVPDGTPLSGAQVANLSPAVAEEYNLDFNETGVIVVAAPDGSAAQRLGFQAGDVVRGVNGRQAADVRALIGLLAGARDSWTLRLERDGEVFDKRFRR